MSAIIIITVLFWLAFCVIVAIAAERRCNRDPIGWLTLSLVISPLLAGLALLAVGPKAPEPEFADVRHRALAKSRKEPSQAENVLAVGAGLAVLLGGFLALWWMWF